jgi:hypothetical protein
MPLRERLLIEELSTVLTSSSLCRHAGKQNIAQTETKGSTNSEFSAYSPTIAPDGRGSELIAMRLLSGNSGDRFMIKTN